MDVHRRLGSPGTYERQIDRLHSRYLMTRMMYELEQDGVSLADLVFHRARASRLIARSVRRGRYVPHPATVRTITVRGKEREVFLYRLTDAIVFGAIAEMLDDLDEPRRSPNLYSYRRGMSSWTALSRLTRFVRAHNAARPDPRDRGLYVVNRDITAYSDSIPVGVTSPLRGMLRELLEPHGEIHEGDWRLIERAVRPEIHFEGSFATRIRGVASGQPVAGAIFNLYLRDLDRELSAIPGGFYARYSDDFVFAHADPVVARDASARIDEIVDGLGLQIKDEKRRDVYLNAAGRPSDKWPEARGMPWVEFLGNRVWADATMGLTNKKLRALLDEVEQRALRTARALHATGDRDAIGRSVCAAVNGMLRPQILLFQVPAAVLLFRIVTDRRQLEQSDRLIAQIVIAAVTGRRGVRVFRDVPYRTVRNEWGLTSLVRARNRWGKPLR